MFISKLTVATTIMVFELLHEESASALQRLPQTSTCGNRSIPFAMNLATRFGTGIPLATVWEGDYPIQVMLKDNHFGLQHPGDVENATVSGVLPSVNVPLRQIAKVQPDWSEGQIVRRNGVRTISVLADVKRNVNLNQVTDNVIKELSTIHMPEGVTMKSGGQRASDEEFMPQIYSGLVISIFVIFVILLFHLKDIRLSVLIMFSLLFSLLGSALGVFIMGQEMGVTGILGIISLMGIIVRNGIIMVDYAEELRIKHHLSAKHDLLFCLRVHDDKIAKPESLHNFFLQILRIAL